MSPERSLNMEQLCKDQAAHRYNRILRKLMSPALSVFRAAMSFGAIPLVKRALSARLMRTASFTSLHALICSHNRQPDARRVLARTLISQFSLNNPVSYCISCSQRVYWSLPFKTTRIQHEILCKSLIPRPSGPDPDLTGLLGSPGCTIVQPLDMEVGAGTSHPMTSLRALGPEPMATAYVQPSRRPTDGRYGENPNRLQHYYQFRW